MTTKTKEKNHARQQAEIQMESIAAMVDTFKAANAEGNDDGLENARQTILDDALSLEVRGPWHDPRIKQDAVSEFQILLCWGGPSVRIMGKLDDAYEPVGAWLEYQDWGSPWTEYRVTSKEEEILLEYCRCFWFGE